MSTELPAVIALAAIGATYIFCVRPGLRGRGMATSAAGCGGAQRDIDRELAKLRGDLQVLRPGGVGETGAATRPVGRAGDA